VKELTLCPVTRVPPSEAKCLDNDREMLPAPPTGIGQPTACPVVQSTRPKAADGVLFRGKMECAAAPAKNPLADAALKWLIDRYSAELRALSPKWVNGKGF
jgi:hypothetical protein